MDICSMLRIKRHFKSYLLALVLLCSIDYFEKPCLNEVSCSMLDNEIRGVGKIKSYKIIKEREVNGNYKNVQDFIERTDSFIGKTVQTRIVRAYKI